MRIKFFFLISLSVFLISCSSNKNIIGTYDYDPPHPGSFSIELKEDSTFVYNWFFDGYSGNTKGRWELIDDKLLLNSHFQLDSNPTHYNLIKAENRNLDSLEIKVIDLKDNFDVYFANCCVKKDTLKICNTVKIESGALFKKAEIDSLFISFLDLQSISYKVLNQKFDYYEFGMKGEYTDANYQYFQNEQFIFHKKRLFPINRENDIKSNYYKKR